MLIRFITPAYAAVLAGLAIGGGPAGAQELRGFHTPSGNIGCMAVSEGGRWELRCDIGQKEWAGPSVGAECDLDGSSVVEK
jgi:hypothetical protein